jgi:hypothetical protein
MDAILTRFLHSIGEFKSVHTMVDFYEYIKGVEYLICVAFFIAFVKYFKYIDAPTQAREKEH